MEKKIYIDGKEQGSINFKKDGIYTVAEAEILSQEKLMRLYIQGGGTTYPLGIMEPKGKKAVFKKRYSKIETKKFPQIIERAVACAFNEKPPDTEKPENAVKSVQQKQTNIGRKEKNIWIRENGNLFYVTEKGKFLAFPSNLRKEVPGIRLKYYKNQQYMLFRY